MSSLSDTLSKHNLFESLRQESLETLSQTAIRKTYAQDEILVQQGDVWPYLFYLAEGEINAVKGSLEGRTLVATTLGPGDVFWGLAFFIEGAPMPVYFQASLESTIQLWRRDLLLPLLKENGGMTWELCSIMISRMQLASEIVEDLAFHPVTSRLAGLLLDHFGAAEDQFVARDFTLEDMAARIGTTREMVCRHLYRFAENGAIEIRRTELRINDRQFLEKQAGKQ